MWVGEVELLGGVIGEHPREHGVLGERKGKGGGGREGTGRGLENEQYEGLKRQPSP